MPSGHFLRFGSAVRRPEPISRPLASRSSSLCGKSLRKCGPEKNSSSATSRRFELQSGQAKASAESFIKEWQQKRTGKLDPNSIDVKGKLTIAKKNRMDMVDFGAVVVDNSGHVLLNKKVLISLVSNELDPETGTPQRTEYSEVKNWWAHDGDVIADEFTYDMTFTVPKDFGEAGAILVSNEHSNEFFLKSLVLDLPHNQSVEFLCESWVYPKQKYANKDRIFFSNKTYLPSATPPGLKALRDVEFKNLRGDGTGQRERWDRVYDYDVYNDLGDPDNAPETVRPVFGGKDAEFKYLADAEPVAPSAQRVGGLEKYEGKPNSKLNFFYVPRDEQFHREKSSSFYASALKGLAHNVVPVLQVYADDTTNEFDSFDEIYDLYGKGVNLDRYADKDQSDQSFDGAVFVDFLFKSEGDSNKVLRYPVPDLIADDRLAWRDDEEFARQFLAGLNPHVIRAVEDFPPKSILDSKEFPNPTDLKDEHILPYLEGLTVQQAMADHKLYIVDYRDLFLPYVNRCEAADKDVKMYGSRAIFFVNSKGVLSPVAIELSRPPTSLGGPCVNEVFTPPQGNSKAKDYRWELAKLHVNNLDIGFHELVSHWGNTHAVMEPFILSTHRNISRLHPLNALLVPLFKNTLYINANARQILISAGGLIEGNFSSGANSTELSAVAYTLFWRFDTNSLPNDLLARGMAVPDDTQPENVRLVLDDYPFARDGLELWEILKGWVMDFVNIAYTSDSAVAEDAEIQKWWEEIVNVGHFDKKDDPWWPKADSRASLIEIVSTMAWIAGPQHAAVNFGQYAYAGFMPNRPPKLRRLVPQVGSKEHAELEADPDLFFLRTLPKINTTMILMSVVELLSHHSADEEYQGTRLNDLWTSDPKIRAAYQRYCARLETYKANIRNRNADPSLAHRAGPSKVQYTLLYPHSTTGVTGQGVPLSISI